MVVLLVVVLVVLPVPATRLMLPANACPAACPASCCRAVSKVFPAYELLGWYAAAPTGEVDADVLALQAQMAVFNESPLCMVLRTSGVRPDDRQLPLAIYRSDVKGEQQHPAAAARSSPQQQGQLGQCSFDSILQAAVSATLLLLLLRPSFARLLPAGGAVTLSPVPYTIETTESERVTVDYMTNTVGAAAMAAAAASVGATAATAGSSSSSSSSSGAASATAAASSSSSSSAAGASSSSSAAAAPSAPSSAAVEAESSCESAALARTSAPLPPPARRRRGHWQQPSRSLGCWCCRHHHHHHDRPPLADISHLRTQASALGMLSERLGVLQRYLQAVEGGAVPPNRALLRQISAVAASVPVADSARFDAELAKVRPRAPCAAAIYWGGGECRSP